MQRSDDVIVKGPVGDLEVLRIHDDKFPEPRGALVFAHPNPTEGGTNRNKVVTTVGKAFVKEGYVVYLPNLRGVGKSEGTFDRGRGEKEDMKAVIDWARLDYPLVTRLVIGGFSFGGFVATLVESEVPASDIVLVAPAVKRYYPDVSPDCARARPFVIYGNEDEVTPAKDIYEWCARQETPVHMIVGASHFFHRKLIVLENLIRGNFPFDCPAPIIPKPIV